MHVAEDHSSLNYLLRCDAAQPIGRDLTMFTRHPTFFVKDKEEQRVRTPRSWCYEVDAYHAGVALFSVLIEL